jgi:hypothetical protein
LYRIILPSCWNSRHFIVPTEDFLNPKETLASPNKIPPDFAKFLALPVLAADFLFTSAMKLLIISYLKFSYKNSALLHVRISSREAAGHAPPISNGCDIHCHSSSL